MGKGEKKQEEQEWEGEEPEEEEGGRTEEGGKKEEEGGGRKRREERWGKEGETMKELEMEASVTALPASALQALGGSTGCRLADS